MSKSSNSARRIAELVQRMHDDIKFGAYTSGEWLKLIDLQNRYSAKQFEMRRVLNELTTQRLVEHRPNSGFRVATPNPEERGQMRFVRGLLERSTAPLIAARATPEDIDELRQLARAFEATVGLEGRQHQAAANFAFHERLFRVSGNKVLVDLILGLRAQSPFTTTGRWHTREGLQGSSDEHFSMVKAIEERDPVELERHIAQHIESF